MSNSHSLQHHIDLHALDSLLQSTLQRHRAHHPRHKRNDFASDSGQQSILAPSMLDPSEYLIPNTVRHQLRRQDSQHSVTMEQLKLSGGSLSSNASSASSMRDSVDVDVRVDESGVETPLTSSEITSPTRFTAPKLDPFASPSCPLSPLPPTSSQPSQPRTISDPLSYYSSLFLASCVTSPASTLTPTSPLKIAFSSPRNHRNDPVAGHSTTTFASCYNQLSPHSKQQYAHAQQQQQRQQQKQQNEEQTQEQQQQQTQMQSENQISDNTEHSSPFRNGSRHASPWSRQPSTSLAGAGSLPPSPTEQPLQRQATEGDDTSDSDSKQQVLPRRTTTPSAGSSSAAHSQSNNRSSLQPGRLQYNELASIDHTHDIFVDHLPSIDHHLGHQHDKSNTAAHDTTDANNTHAAPTSEVLSIHVRYVHKDLWVQVNVPKDMPVHKARDMILSKCRLTCMPPQQQQQHQFCRSSALPPISSSLPPSSAQLPSVRADFLKQDPALTLSHWHRGIITEKDGTGSRRSRLLTVDTSTLNRPGMLSPQYSGGTSTPASRSRRPSRCSGLHDDDSFCDQESIGDDEAELQAEELMADDLFPQSPPGRVSYDQTRSGLKDTMWQGFAEGVKTMMNNKADHIYRQHHRQSQPLEAQSLVQRQAHLQHRHQRSYSTIDGSRDYYAGRKMEQGALDDIQLQRLISYSMLHKDQREKRPEAGLSAASDRGSKEICSTVARLSQSIPGWSAYRSRQNSSNARHMVREVLDHGGILADCMDEEVVPRSETRKSECSAWKACFGLFWVAAGHWLDDSRLISSYNLQPHCLLELQLRNNYVQLPPPGTSLNYYDHYAEGVLYKMSKKSRPVSKLTSHGSKDLATDGGVWKERWVVLQGSKLLIYHKSKDTTKKSIELEMPVSVMVTVVPHNPRQCFKLVCNNTSPMSNTMITLTVSPDPTIPKVCFRATSESELNHWVRIFNSLNYATSNGLNPPPMDPTVASWSSPASTPIVLPPPLPPLPLLPPPVSTDDSSNHDIVKKRDRHHSYTGNTNGTVGDHRNGVAGFTAGFTAERRRCHTTQHGPTLMASINPVLISNAAVALSNYQGSVDGDSEYGGSIGMSNRSSPAPSRSASISRRVLAGRDRSRTTSQASTLVGSLLNGRDVSQIQHRPLSLSRHASLLSSASSGGHHRFQRQRTITEVGVPPSAASGSLNRRIRAASFGMNTQRNSRQDLMQEHLERLRAATPEPWTKAKQEMDVSVLNTLENMTPLNLDPGSQALFNASSAQCSGPPLFSGYVWLYIPNSATTLSQSSQGPNAAQKSIGSSIPTLSTSALFPTGDVAGHNAPTLSKRSSCSSILSTSTEQRSVSNICITKASGRFVKCFAVINQMGHFQWLEVDENEPQQQQQQQQQQHSNSSHGIRLSPQQKTNGDPIEASVPSLKCVKEVGTQGQKSGDQANSTVTTPRPVKAGGVKACVAHKMRLHFFCINIALSSLPDTIMEPPVPPQPSSSVFSAPSSVSECSSRRGHQSRFSAPLTHQKTLSLNPPVIPMRVTSLQRLATQTSGQGQLPSYKFPLDETKPLWPSMSLVHERSQSAAVPQTVHIPTPPPERALSKTFAALKSRSSASLTSSLSGSGPGSDDASVDDAPLAVSALLPNAHVARSLLTKTQSLFIENRGRTRSAPPAGSNVLSKLGRSRLMATHTQDDVSGHETDLMKRHTSQLLLSNTRRGTLYPSAEEVAANAGATEVAAAKASDTVAAPSQILSLAEQLQKTMQQVRGENQDPNHHGYERSSGNDENVTDEVSGRESTKSQVPSLQEITAKKRESAQRMKNSANVEAARLKLVGGHVDVQAEQQPGDTKARWPSQVRKRNAEVMDRKRIGEVSQQQQQQQLPPALRMLLTQCPFLEQSEILRDAEGERVVTLKGYTETEEAWKALQSALERFVDGPVKDQRSALPPEETLIPSYHAPRLPEVRLSEKARSFLKAKDRVTATALAAAISTVEMVKEVDIEEEEVEQEIAADTRKASMYAMLPSTMMVVSARLSRINAQITSAALH